MFILSFERVKYRTENMEGPEINKTSSKKLTLFDDSDSETDNFDVKKVIENRVRNHYFIKVFK